MTSSRCLAARRQARGVGRARSTHLCSERTRFAQSGRMLPGLGFDLKPYGHPATETRRPVTGGRGARLAAARRGRRGPVLCGRSPRPAGSGAGAGHVPGGGGEGGGRCSPFGAPGALQAAPASLPSAPALPGAMAGHPSMPKVRDRKQGRTRQNERGKKEPQAVIIGQGRPLPRTFH